MDVAAPTQLLPETEENHGSFEAIAPQHDWQDWYAAYRDARPRPARSHLPHRTLLERQLVDAGLPLLAELRSVVE